MSVKPGTGDSTQHGDNRQGSNGPGVKNVPLKKSTANPQPPSQQEGKPHAAGAPKHAPQAKAKSGNSEGRNTVAVVEGHTSKTSSTYRAPRSEGSSNPVECGYTKPGKM